MWNVLGKLAIGMLIGYGLVIAISFFITAPIITICIILRALGLMS